MREEKKRDQVDQERSHEPSLEAKSPKGHVTNMIEYIALRSWEMKA